MATKKKFGFRQILSVITLILIAFVVFKAKDQVFEAIKYLGNTNLWLILLLIPEQLFMYYCAGQMFFSYMAAKKDAQKISKWNLMRIAFELNFVNHAVPSGGVSGLGYMTWRLKPFGATAGQTSFMYVLRYAITVCANQAQTILAIIALLIMGGLTPAGKGVLWLAGAMCFGIILAIIAVVIVASSKKRIDWFAAESTKFVNWLVSKITFGRKTKVLQEEAVNKYFEDLHGALTEARNNKKILIKPIIWGVVYSFFEVATYWIVGMSMGHPEILPQVMVAEAIGSVAGAVLPTPGGMGGYEGSMVAVMLALGVEASLGMAVVVTTRVVVLVGTIASGYGFYQHAISKIGKKEQKEIENAG